MRTHTLLSPTALSSICAQGVRPSRNTLSLSLAKSYLPIKMELVNSLPPPLPPLPLLQIGAGTLSLTKMTIANSTACFHSFPKHALLAAKIEDFLRIGSPVVLNNRYLALSQCFLITHTHTQRELLSSSQVPGCVLSRSVHLPT